jgi:hypothetical protein
MITGTGVYQWRIFGAGLHWHDLGFNSWVSGLLVWARHVSIGPPLLGRLGLLAQLFFLFFFAPTLPPGKALVCLARL